MVQYDLTPDGSSSPTIRLYDESLRNIPRRQSHEVERHATIQGASPAADSNGLAPGDIRFEGRWLGASAADIADSFRNNFLDDASVNKVNVQAVDDAGSNVSSRFNGTYLIADESRVDKEVAQSERNWRYRIVLIEA